MIRFLLVWFWKTLHDIGFACLQRQAVAKQKKELLGNEG